MNGCGGENIYMAVEPVHHHKIIGRELHTFSSVASTNTIALQMAQAGAPEGVTVIADEQTGGRGRLGRIWKSPPGVNLYMSVILRPTLSASDAPRVTITAGVAVAEALTRFCPGDVSIKWPNDVLLKGRKVSGILSEMKAGERGTIDFVIVGIGVNINSDGDCLGPALCHSAISLKDVLLHEVSRAEVTNEVIMSFDTWYNVLITRGFNDVREQWRLRCTMMGREVTIRDGDTTLTGVAEDIDRTGALILDDRTSNSRHVISGEIVIMGE